MEGLIAANGSSIASLSTSLTTKRTHAFTANHTGSRAAGPGHCGAAPEAIENATALIPCTDTSGLNGLRTTSTRWIRRQRR